MNTAYIHSTKETSSNAMPWLAREHTYQGLRRYRSSLPFCCPIFDVCRPTCIPKPVSMLSWFKIAVCHLRTLLPPLFLTYPFKKNWTQGLCLCACACASVYVCVCVWVRVCACEYGYVRARACEKVSYLLFWCEKAKTAIHSVLQRYTNSLHYYYYNYYRRGFLHIFSDRMWRLEQKRRKKHDFTHFIICMICKIRYIQSTTAFKTALNTHLLQSYYHWQTLYPLHSPLLTVFVDFLWCVRSVRACVWYEGC